MNEIYNKIYPSKVQLESKEKSLSKIKAGLIDFCCIRQRCTSLVMPEFDVKINDKEIKTAIWLFSYQQYYGTEDHQGKGGGSNKETQISHTGHEPGVNSQSTIKLLDVSKKQPYFEDSAPGIIGNNKDQMVFKYKEKDFDILCEKGNRT